MFTPGFTTTVADGLRSNTLDVAGMRQTALNQLRDAGRGNETVAAVSWLGYDAPQWDTITHADRSVALPNDAQHAGVDLARFYDGINTSRPTDAHLTAVGHSYGSTTTGYALQHTTTPIDDAVVFGSPGLGTGNRDDLHVPAGHLNVIKAYKDPIAQLGSFGGDPSTLDDARHLAAYPATIPGGTSKLTGSTGHSEYFIPGSTSQYNIAAAVADLPEKRITAPEPGIRDVLYDMTGLF